MPYKNTCNTCSSTFESKKKSKKYCSTDCIRIARKSMSIVHICSNCNSKITGRNYSSNGRGSISKNIFCDRNCYDDYRKKVKPHSEKECANCGLKFMRNNCIAEYKRSFCSMNCKKEFGFKIVAEKHKVKGISPNGMYVKECKICKKDFLTKKTKPYNSVCSKECISVMYKTDENRKNKISKAFQGEKHPNYVNGCSFNERVRKTEIKEIFSSDDKKYIYELFNSKCFNCGSTKMLSLDHHIPFSRGGRLTIANTVLLCRSCNSKKNAKMPHDFYSQKQLKKLEKMGITSNSVFAWYA